MTDRCSRPGCLYRRDESPRRPEEDASLCALHRQEDRTRRGVCLNCGAPFVLTHEINELTGRPLLRDGLPVEIRTCSDSCGYVRRARPTPRRRRR